MVSVNDITLTQPSEGLADGLNGLDIAVIVIILFMVLAVGIYASIVANEFPLAKYFSCFQSKVDEHPSNASNAASPGRKQSLLSGDPENPHTQGVENFFLADRSMAWYFVGTSLFASNIGSEHFVGQAGDGARRGLPVAMYELYAAILLLLLGWVFSPIYRRAQVYTTPEFLEYRFSAPCRDYLSVVTCVMYVLTKMSASIYGGAVILSATLGWDLYWSAGLCIVLSTLYTICGGLRAVMYTDLFQTMIFVVGGFIVMGYSLNEVGGLGGLQDRLNAQGKEDFWHLFKPPSDEDYPWTGMLIGQPIGSVWYWCMDQDLVQRVLASKDNLHAKSGCVLASLLKILPMFIMVIPGIVAGSIYDLSDTKNSEDDAYASLLTNLMPHGVIGLMIASIMTAMMSSLDSVFNAGSSIVTNDIYRRFYPNASEKQLVWVGRVATLVYAILSFLWIPILSSGEGLYRQVVEIQGYLTPPVGIILVIGVTWKRANKYGALSGLLIGGVLGVTRLIVSVGFDSLEEELTGVVHTFFYMNFQHFAILLWVTSGLVCIVVSLCTPPPSDAVDKFTIQWHEIFAVTADEAKYSSSTRHFVLGAAAAVLVATLSIWIAFG